MSKATENELGALHAQVARGLTQVIQEGVPVEVGKDEEGEKIIERGPAPAAYYAAAIALLKNNNITADAEANSDLDRLKKTLDAKRKDQKANLQSSLDAAHEFARQFPDGLPTQ